MKRILLFLSAVFIATTAIAEQITINWGADNQLYTTTTCEIGDNVILPSTPTKRGHIFKGWQAVHFDRGTFENWDSVADNVSMFYMADRYDNNVPKKDDYMFVIDVSDYDTINIIATQAHVGDDYYKDVIVNYKGKVHTYNQIRRGDDVLIFGGRIKIHSTANNWQYIALQDIKYENTVYHSGDVFFSRDSWWFNNLTVKAQLNSENEISGKWRFIYDGLWEIDGKAGWKPETQITE